MTAVVHVRTKEILLKLNEAGYDARKQAKRYIREHGWILYEQEKTKMGNTILWVA